MLPTQLKRGKIFTTSVKVINTKSCDTMTKIIEVKNLYKIFNSKIIALDHISFDVHENEIFGYLGPNGAGKSTTIRILTSISRATSGEAKIAGLEVKKYEYETKKLISLVPEQPIIYPEFTGLENLLFTGALYRIPQKKLKERAINLLKEIDLYERRNQLANEYSKGMKRRLSVAMGLITNPKILFLDEPTSGLDVTSTRLIRKKIIELKEKGITVFLTTHNMEEASKVCDRVAILKKGRILIIDTPEALKNAINQSRSFDFLIRDEYKEKIESYLKEKEQEFTILPNKMIKVVTGKPAEFGQELLIWAKQNNVYIKKYQTSDPKLADVFLSLTSGEKQDEISSFRKKEQIKG